jgi:transcriptional regulator with XRE-family HTH domain
MRYRAVLSGRSKTQELDVQRIIYSKPYLALVRRMRARRLELGLSQAQLAAKVGRTGTWLQKCENLRRRIDFVETVDLLRALDIDLDDAVRFVIEKAR